METDVTNVCLTANETRLLKQISKNPIRLKCGDEFPEKYQTLLDRELIGDPQLVVQLSESSNSDRPYFKYSISEYGLEYLRYRKEKFTDINLVSVVSIVIAVAALAVSIIALLKE